MHLLIYYVLGEIILLEGLTCVYRGNVELFFYVVASSQENEVRFFYPKFLQRFSLFTSLLLFYSQIALTQVLNCLYDTCQRFLGKVFERRVFMDNLDSAFLVIDEIVDGG